MVNKKNGNEPNTQEPDKKTLRKTRKLLRRVVPLTLVIFIVLVIAVLSSMESSDHFAALRRYLKYGDSAQTQDLYTYASHQDNLFEPLGEHLLVVNPH